MHRASVLHDDVEVVRRVQDVVGPDDVRVGLRVQQMAQLSVERHEHVRVFHRLLRQHLDGADAVARMLGLEDMGECAASQLGPEGEVGDADEGPGFVAPLLQGVVLTREVFERPAGEHHQELVVRLLQPLQGLLLDGRDLGADDVARLVRHVLRLVDDLQDSVRQQSLAAHEADNLVGTRIEQVLPDVLDRLDMLRALRSAGLRLSLLVGHHHDDDEGRHLGVVVQLLHRSVGRRLVDADRGD
mmetsp:Transcript_122609/g.352237  ORF Transcript_122609/g.352237 Transcript_122609/m.352237 type:complete len:243 (-) Transcript_122609:228-956(-)